LITYPLAVGGLETRVIEAGEGDRLLLFLHGLGARADRWRATVGTFADDGFRTCALDFPGHGFATKGDRPDYSVSGFARFVQDFLEVKAPASVVLVGTSLGGQVAARVACDAAVSIDGLVLVGTLGVAPVPTSALEAIAAGVSDRSRLGVRAKLTKVLGEAATDELVEEEYRFNQSPGAALAFERLAGYVRNELANDLLGDELAALTSRLPILLVWGRDDGSVPLEIGREVARRLSGAPLAVIDEARHAPYLEQPDRFNSVVRAFLAGNRWQGAGVTWYEPGAGATVE